MAPLSTLSALLCAERERESQEAKREALNHRQRRLQAFQPRSVLIDPLADLSAVGAYLATEVKAVILIVAASCCWMFSDYTLCLLCDYGKFLDNCAQGPLLADRLQPLSIAPTPLSGVSHLQLLQAVRAALLVRAPTKIGFELNGHVISPGSSIFEAFQHYHPNGSLSRQSRAISALDSAVPDSSQRPSGCEHGQGVPASAAAAVAAVAADVTANTSAWTQKTSLLIFQTTDNGTCGTSGDSVVATVDAAIAASTDGAASGSEATAQATSSASKDILGPGITATTAHPASENLSSPAQPWLLSPALTQCLPVHPEWQWVRQGLGFVQGISTEASQAPPAIPGPAARADSSQGIEQEHQLVSLLLLLRTLFSLTQEHCLLDTPTHSEVAVADCSAPSPLSTGKLLVPSSAFVSVKLSKMLVAQLEDPFSVCGHLSIS